MLPLTQYHIRSLNQHTIRSEVILALHYQFKILPDHEINSTDEMDCFYNLLSSLPGLHFRPVVKRSCQPTSGM